jgi:pimeloyl-ACP methyl ester carboxylesterase
MFLHIILKIVRDTIYMHTYTSHNLSARFLHLFFVTLFLLIPSFSHATVLFDNSKADKDWDIGLSTGGHYAYFFKGYETIGNPPTVTSENTWVSTGTTTTVRIKKAPTLSCHDITHSLTGGLNIFAKGTNTLDGAHFGTHPYVYGETPEYCDFYMYPSDIPPGTEISGIFMGLLTGSVAGSDFNPGSSFDGYYGNPIPGGFAFQLCDAGGCSGGFSTTTATTTATTTLTGASNVMFLPGITGSRLYHRINGVEEQLWEPAYWTSQSKIKLLNLDANGNSINAVYAKRGDILGQAHIATKTIDIYKTFLEQLATLKANGTINKYEAFSYDWRKSPIDVAEGPNKYESGDIFLANEVEDLARISKTGKVILVGHSNGGLVAKALMKKLEREGKAGLVDKIILVDSPQLGTPDAIATLLHGDFDPLTNYGGTYISKENMRNLALTMPDAYALLPSQAYFNKVADPVINLADAPELRAAAGISRVTINSQADFVKFMTGSGGRAKPASADIETPNTLSSTLLASSTALHAYLDDWIATSSVQVIEVAGWGRDTTKGITYTESKGISCPAIYGICSDITKLAHRLEMTEDGDQTVVIPSEVAGITTKTYYLNLQNANPAFQKNWKHSDITESVPFQNLFSLLVATSSPQILPAFVTTVKPEAINISKRLRLRILSPVSLDAYDSQGRHTGLIQNPGGEILAKEEEIPNSYYREYGEGKYLGLPAEDTITIKMKGLDIGTFTFEATSVDSATSTTVSYKDIPVTASSTAQLIISQDKVQNASLTLDINGDGIIDTTLASSSQAQTPLVYVRLIKLSADQMDLSTSTKRQLSAKFSNIEKLILKDSRWDDEDDDNDKNDIKKNERIEKRILRKLDKIDSYIQRILSKPVPKKGKVQITPTQAEALLSMTAHLRILIK